MIAKTNLLLKIVLGHHFSMAISYSLETHLLTKAALDKFKIYRLQQQEETSASRANILAFRTPRDFMNQTKASCSEQKPKVTILKYIAVRVILMIIAHRQLIKVLEYETRTRIHLFE
jgi:hypothetical protein